MPARGLAQLYFSSGLQRNAPSQRNQEARVLQFRNGSAHSATSRAAREDRIPSASARAGANPIRVAPATGDAALSLCTPRA